MSNNLIDFPPNKTLTKSQFIEFISLMNFRNHLKKENHLIATNKSWPLIQEIIKGVTNIDFSKTPHIYYEDKDLWQKISMCMQSAIEIDRKTAVFVQYKTASDLTRLMGINSQRKYFKLAPVHFNTLNLPIPINPPHYYTNDWISWGEFLQTKSKSNHFKKLSWWPYERAREYIRKKGIRSIKDFHDFMKYVPEGVAIPLRPDAKYAEEGWTNWSDFLLSRFYSYEEAKSIMKEFRLKTSTEFNNLSAAGRRPKGIPSLPKHTYKEEFISWQDFLSVEENEAEELEQTKLTNI